MDNRRTPTDADLPRRRGTHHDRRRTRRVQSRDLARIIREDA